MSRLRKNSDQIIQLVYQTIREHGLFEAGDSVLVGVSGGPDSVVLLHVLNELAPALSLRLGIAHLNHGLRRPASDREAKFVSSLAKRIQLPFYTEIADVLDYRRRYRMSLEEAARHMRYRFFSKIAEQNIFDRIATGHHQDDNAELVLMYMIRGSGPLGLSGIPPMRNGRIVRPLMGLTRSQIHDFVTEKKLDVVFDASNTDEGFIRNRVRNRLIPVIKESYNPRIIETLNRQACILRDEEKWIETVIEPMFRELTIEESDGGITISVHKTCALHIGAKRRVIRKAIHIVKGNLRRIGFPHVDAVLRLMDRGPVYGSIDLPDRIRIRRCRDLLIISKEKIPLRHRTPHSEGSQSLSFKYSVTIPGPLYIQEINARLQITEIAGSDLSYFDPLNPAAAYFDRERLHFPLLIRNVLPGDRFTPLGMTGTQKVKTYFINNKVDRSLRANCPVLLSGDNIIWVVGHRIDDSVKVLPSTRNVLKMELFLA